MAMTKTELKSKIIQLFPEIEKYGLDLDVEMDKTKNVWLAKFNKDEHRLVTHLEEKDVEDCLAGIKCYKIGIQLGQFIRNYCEDGENCRLGM